MDTTAFGEGKYITKELVKNSPTKIATILMEATIVKGTYGDQLSFEVEMDKKTKLWNPSTEQVNVCNKAFGTNSLLWIGKQVQFLVIPIAGKEKLVCVAKL